MYPTRTIYLLLRILFISAYLCQLLSTNAADTECTGTEIQGQCYFIARKNVTWAEAIGLCKDYNGELAQVINTEIHEAIRQLMIKESVGNVWIGLFETFYEWKWITDNKVLSPQGCFIDNITHPEYTVIKPVSDLTAERCITECRLNNFKYAATQNGDTCFCGQSYGKYGEDYIRKFRCTKECASSDSDMSLFCGGYETNFVYNTQGVHARWGFKQPNNYDGIQKCGVIEPSLSYKLADEKCFKPYRFLCAMPPPHQCDELQPNCYKISDSKWAQLSDNFLNWFDARQACHSDNAELISIDSYAEHDVIKSWLGTKGSTGPFWIGLSKGLWQWTSGKPFTYSNWGKETPNGKEENCVAISKDVEYKWDDQRCSDRRYFVCRGDSSQLSTPATSPTPITKSSTASTPSTSNETTTGYESTAVTVDPTDYESTAETTRKVVPPSSGGAGEEPTGVFNTVEIVLVVVCCFLAVLLIILAISAGVIMYRKKRRRLSSHDARQDAVKPNSIGIQRCRFPSAASAKTMNSLPYSGHNIYESAD